MASVLSIPVTDIEGKSKPVMFHFDNAALVADIITYYESVAPQIDNVTRGEVSALATLTLEIAIASTGLKANPLAGSRVTNGLNMSFLNSANAAHGIYIPSIDDDFISGGFGVTGVANDLDLLISGILSGGGTAIPRDRNNLDLVSFWRAKQANRK